jgi:uncharacterized membrane protein YwaF
MPDGVEAAPKRSIWWSFILSVVLFVVAFVAAWQAVALAWLSAFPQSAPHLDVLRTKFWIYVAVSALSLIACVVLLVRFDRADRASRSAARQQVEDPD